VIDAVAKKKRQTADAERDIERERESLYKEGHSFFE